MNKVSIERLFGLMCMAGWSKNQIYKITNELVGLHPRERDILISTAFDAVSEYHYAIGDKSRQNISDRDEASYYKDSGEQLVAYESYEPEVRQISLDSPIVTEIYEKIRDYLVVELGLSAYEVVDLVSAEMYKINKGEVPPLSKKSLRNWVARLISVHSPSQVLHVLTSIRNKTLQSHSRGWSLRNG